jgi:hypothetical protein
METFTSVAGAPSVGLTFTMRGAHDELTSRERTTPAVKKIPAPCLLRLRVLLDLPSIENLPELCGIFLAI